MRSIQTQPRSYVHSSYLRRTYSQLLARNIDVQRVFDAANLRLEEIHIPDALIDIQVFNKIVSEAKKILCCPWMPLLLITPRICTGESSLCRE